MSVANTEGTGPPSRRLSVSDHHRVADAGFFAPNERLELIEGEPIEMTPIGSRHAATTDKLIRLLSTLVADAAIVRVQSPVVLPPDSEVQPDLMLLKLRDDFYASAHPGPADVLLLIEVGDASRRPDREVKLPLYARLGIAEVWRIDLQDGCLQVHREPDSHRYRTVMRPTREEEITPSRLPSCVVPVSELFPPDPA